jgi:uncharacterized protein (TIGR03435 family)
MDFTPGGGLRATNVTLNLLIEMAYGIRPDQLSGGPGWADSLQFNIVAKGPQRPPTRSDVKEAEMLRRLQALLADRFHLSLGRSSKTRSGFALVIAKGGPKMTESAAPQQLRQMGVAGVKAEGVGMELLARFLAVRVQEDVVDRTGLTGRYDFTLRWEVMPVSAAAGQTPGNAQSDAASLFPALQEQLGLRLEREKVVGETFVIEHADKPTEN